MAQIPSKEGTSAFLNSVFSLLAVSLPPDRTWPDGNWPLIGGFDPPWLEIVLGAVLTQNTRWENVSKTLPQLKARGLGNLRALDQCQVDELEEAVRSTGFFRQKARTIKRICRFLLASAKPQERVKREDLLAIKGIGLETADSILLYGFDRPEFVADAYSRRLLQRLGMIEREVDYAEGKRIFESFLMRDSRLYRDYHARIVQHAKQICRKRPLCDRCPVSQMCQSHLANQHENDLPFRGAAGEPRKH